MVVLIVVGELGTDPQGLEKKTGVNGDFKSQ